MEKIEILGVPMTRFSEAQSVEKFVALAKGDDKVFAATPNAEIVLAAGKNPELLDYLQKCRLNFADSVSLLWAGECIEKNWGKLRAICELLFLPIRKNSWKTFPERVTGSGSFEKICGKCEAENVSIALIGGGDGVAQITAEKLRENFPNLEIVAAIDGLPFGEFWEEKVVGKLEGAQVAFVALGCPRQEFWVRDNLQKVKSLRIGIGIGGTFDFYAGTIKRAPKIFQVLGMEWLFRLMMEPSRWKRILTAVFVFPWEFLRSW